ncbi:MAG: hypothetical protein WBY44_23035 [Bryobacteraceae bacterium]
MASLYEAADRARKRGAKDTTAIAILTYTLLPLEHAQNGAKIIHPIRYTEPLAVANRYAAIMYTGHEFVGAIGLLHSLLSRIERS